MTKVICQCIILALFAFSFFVNIHRDYTGTKDKKPEGVRGVASSVLVVALFATLFYFAGAFTELIELLQSL